MSYTIRDFLEIRTAAAGGFSPDASKVLIHSNLSGTMQLYRVSRFGGELTTITDFDEPVAGGYFPASDELLLAMDEGGNERTQLSIIDDDGRNLRRLVHDPEFIHRPGGTTRDGKRLAYASNRRNGVDFDVYVRHVASGEERCVFQMGGWCQPAGFSPDGRYLAVVRLTERNGDNDVHLVDLVSEETWSIAPHDDDAEIGRPAWLPDSSAFFFSHDIDREFSAIARYDMATRRWRRVLELPHDLSCQIDWPGSKLIVTINEDGYTRQEIYDPSDSLKRPRATLPQPARGLSSTTISHDGKLIAYTFVSSRHAGDAWLHDTVTGATHRLTRSPNAIPEDVFVEPELHRYASFDGERIPVFLYRPRTPARTPAPVVVYIHGGPESQFVPSFNPIVQYLVYRGFAVVAPNVRGSTGYGKRFHHLDDVYRRLDSVRDLEGLHAWLGRVGGLDPTRAALMGGSYGGYMTLAGLAFQPELWAAGVDIVGMSSLVTFLENTAPWRRKFREREYGSLDRDREFLLEVSPITHVDRIRAPLFIIHGTNDPRVPLGEAQQMHAILQQRGIPTELLVYPDEGHGLGKLKNRLDAYPKVADFLERILA